MSKKNRLMGKRILIVDDEPDVLETLAELLDECSIETAGSFEHAAEKLENDSFDLTVLDIMGVDGYKLLEIASKRKIVAVMLTAHAVSPEHVVKSFKKGASFYLPKEEMADIRSYLEDILEDLEKGKNTWGRWLGRLGAYCEQHFGPDWQKGDKIFWEKFPFH